MIKPLGNVNAHARSVGWLGNKAFDFDATTLGLVKAAIANGAKTGDKVLANYSGTLRNCAREMRIIAAPHDVRAGGFWVEDY